MKGAELAAEAVRREAIASVLEHVASLVRRYTHPDPLELLEVVKQAVAGRNIDVELAREMLVARVLEDCEAASLLARLEHGARLEVEAAAAATGFRHAWRWMAALRHFEPERAQRIAAGDVRAAVRGAASWSARRARR